jgi:putative transposase
LSHDERRALIDRFHPTISIARQAQLFDISRASVYYRSVVSEKDKRIMAAIDRIYTDCPFYGSRRIQWALADDYGIRSCREHIQRLMRLMGIEAIYPRTKGHLSLPDPQHRVYPYLLRDLAIDHPNQVWGSDITYVKLETGWCYLIAILDWFSRYVVSWNLSASLELSFCIEALSAGLTQTTPEIFNTDQGSHFTSNEFVGMLKERDIRISMDGRGRCLDNIFTERLWRTVKYENVYLQSYHDIGEAREGLTRYFQFYNTKRRHQSLHNQTPAAVYFKGRSQLSPLLLEHKSSTASLSKLSTITV